MSKRRRPRQPLNRGLDYRRTKFTSSFREKAFADSWEKEAAWNKGHNYGWGILQDLMFQPIRNPAPWQRLGWYFGQPMRCVFKITRREAVIVATVIQWLGTNCGWCWLDATLRSCGYKIVKIETGEGGVPA